MRHLSRSRLHSRVFLCTLAHFCVQVLNSLSVESEPLKRGARVVDPINKPRRVYLSRMYDCVIFHDFELRCFPFDVQHLAINLELKNHAFEGCSVRVLPIECRSLNTLAEWSILRPLSSLEEGKSRWLVTIKVPLRRATAFYMRNEMTLAGISLLGLISFTYPLNSLHDRIEMVLAVLFTLVAFSFSISDSLPKVGYSTVHDHYQTFCQATLACIALLHALLEGELGGVPIVLTSAAVKQRIYLWVARVTCLLWSVFNAAYFLYWTYESEHARAYSATLRPQPSGLIDWTGEWSQGDINAHVAPADDLHASRKPPTAITCAQTLAAAVAAARPPPSPSVPASTAATTAPPLPPPLLPPLMSASAAAPPTSTVVLGPPPPRAEQGGVQGVSWVARFAEQGCRVAEQRCAEPGVPRVEQMRPSSRARGGAGYAALTRETSSVGSMGPLSREPPSARRSSNPSGLL